MSIRNLLSGFYLLFLSVGFSQTLNLSNPNQFTNVEFTIAGNENSSHYRKPLLLRLKNNSGKAKTIAVDHGQLMHSVDPGEQDFVIVKDEVVALKPGETKTIPLHAMCIEKSNSAPTGSSQYTPGPMADTNLLGLTNLIAKDELYNYEAQTAVWAMLGNTDLGNIVGYDTCLIRSLVNHVANARDEEPPPPPSSDEYSRNYYAASSTYKVMMGGEFEYKLFESREITIAMFDRDNIVVRELFKDAYCPPGKHKMDFKFDATEYSDEYYWVRLLEDGEIILEMEIKTPDRLRRG